MILLFESLSSEYLNLLRFRRIQEEEDVKKENQLLAINSTPPSLVLIKEKKRILTESADKDYFWRIKKKNNKRSD